MGGSTEASTVTPFHDLHDYMALPRLTGLRLSPDGSWLAASVSALSADGRTFKPSIWRIPAGPGPAHPGEPATDICRVGRAGGPADPVGRGRGQSGLPAGRLAAVPVRPARPAGRPARRWRTGQRPARQRPPGHGQPGAARADGTAGKRALWLLPAGGGEACQLTGPPGGISRLATAAAAPLAAFTCPVLPGASGIADDAQRRKSRADAGVTGILHEAAPVRHWDHDLGPDQLRLLVTGADPGGRRPRNPPPRRSAPNPGRPGTRLRRAPPRRARTGVSPKLPATSPATLAERWTSITSS